MTTPDPRLTDPRIRAARRVEWDDPKQWDGDVPRPGFVERLAPYDRDVDDTLNPPHQPVRVDSLAATNPVTEPHTGFGIRLVAVTVMVVACAVITLAAVGFAFLAGWLS